MKSILKKYTVPILLLVLVAYFAVAAPGFATWNNFFNLLRQVAILGIVSAGMTPVILCGQIDLSVGSAISLVSCLVALLVVNAGMNPILACLIGIVVAMVAVGINGVVVLGTGMPSMLCTMATSMVYQGLAYAITGATPVYGLPESLRMVGQGYLFSIPIPVLIMVAAFIVVGFILTRTYVGRYVYAVGSNPEAARLSGISVTKVVLGAFVMCGALVGLASCVQMSRLFGGFPTAGSGLEMDVVTAVVVGGVSFSGGRGKISGVALGVLLMGVLYNGLGIMGVNSYIQMIVRGLVLMGVVGLDCWQRYHVHRSSSKREVAPTAPAATTEA